MTPQERQLIDDLFDRLAKLEGSPRDANAEAAIISGLRRAPNAAYALVQTVLVQDEALKRANARIEELEAQGAGQQQSGSFLDSMRDAVFGQGQPQRGSVPNVRAPDVGSRPAWNTGQALPPGYGQAPAQGGPGYGQPYGGQQPPPMPGGGGGGSFLGTAAAAAAGVVGGSLLLSSIRGMMGGSHQQSFGDAGGLGSGGGSKPWSDQSGSTLAHDAGIDDVGSSGRGGSDYGSRQGMFDQASNEHDDDDNDIDHDSDGFDGDGDSDYA
jgi:uncharacterized protein